MRISKLTVVGGLAVTFCLLQAPLHAQSGPQELPPASFTGDQYVDRDGCVYIRADVNSATRWVPRVTSDRQQICGFSPTFPATAATAATAEPAATGETTATTKPVPRPGVPDDTVYKGKTPTGSGTATARVTEERFLPEHLVAERQAARSVFIPKGFRTVWNDDRLNLRRGEQTRSGQQRTDAVWTNTVPRRLK